MAVIDCNEPAALFNVFKGESFHYFFVCVHANFPYPCDYIIRPEGIRKLRYFIHVEQR